MALTLLLAMGAGYWLDGKLGTKPLFLLVGGAFGLFAALYNFFKSLSRRS